LKGVIIQNNLGGFAKDGARKEDSYLRDVKVAEFRTRHFVARQCKQAEMERSPVAKYFKWLSE
jgi:hypothetical protein